MSLSRRIPAPVQPRVRSKPTRRAILLLASIGLVHWTWARALAQAPAKRNQRKPAPDAAPGIKLGTGAAGLPPAVLEMRAAIQSAVESGDIAELKDAMDLNELKPEFGGPVDVDPITYLRSVSVDGTGKDVLDMLGRLLDGSWAAIPGGRDIENNRIYVWPHFAELPLASLSAHDQVALTALSGEEAARSMIVSGRWHGWRLSIGADGVWHMFTQVK